MKPSNPFLAPDYEDHLKALTRGPMTSNAEGVLIRPVDQLAEAVRSLHGKVTGLERALAHHKHTDGCINYAAMTGHAYCIRECRDSRAALAAPPTAAIRKGIEAKEAGRNG